MVEPSPPPATPARPAAPKTWDWRILPIAGFTGLVIWILVRNLAGADEFTDALASARWEWGAASIGLLFVCQYIAARRWMIILDALGHPIPFMRAAKAMLATWPMALLAPARASDLLRSLAIADLCPPLLGAGSVIAEKAIDVQSLCLLAIVGSLAFGVPLVAVLAAGLLLAEWAFVWLLVHRRAAIARLPLLRRKPEKLEQVLVAFTALLQQPRRLAAVSATSLLSWIAGTALFQCLLVMVDADVGIVATAALWPAAIFAGMMPLTLAGMGTRDVAFIYLLRAAGHTPIREGALLAATLGYSAVGTWLFAILGIPLAVQFVLRLRRPAVAATARAAVGQNEDP
jgi:uncharacterized protein (TIRG00374 family)